MTRLRTALVDLSLRFDETERLPITVSVGLATYPEHAIVGHGAARRCGADAGGGQGERRRHGPPCRRPLGDDPAANTSFDVLQGLVIAVDTKDRYTKRHSEDVARYATFIARRIGLSPDEIRTIELAGRLHDIGKIGIPDAILRKPGHLTDAEYAIVQQHVALGDMIVRDLPDIDAVRAGIRHHHERWDGQGYLDRLAGESIPKIARILAVADAFSAMTTTRPYRKALDVREALVRLGDAAGTQLDEDLVITFIDGIEHDADPPLPGEAGSPAADRTAPVGGMTVSRRRRCSVWPWVSQRSGSRCRRPTSAGLLPVAVNDSYTAVHGQAADRCGPRRPRQRPPTRRWLHRPVAERCRPRDAGSGP